MYIKNINVQNFRAFQDISIEFKPGVNLVLGDNGVGKSSLLNAIVIALGGFFSGVAGVKSPGILQADIRIEKTNLTEVSQAIKYVTPVILTAEIDIEGVSYDCQRMRKNQNGDTTTSAKDLKKYAEKITNNPESVLPIFSYQTVQRGTNFKRGDFGAKSKNKLNDRRCGYIGCLDDRLDINEAKQWCMNMELEEFKRQEKVPEYETFKNIVTTFMKQMNELDSQPVIEYSRIFEDFVYSEGNTILPISSLSAGYQSVLFMLMDLSFRLALLNPKDPLFNNAPGIIVIDEIDMHLHPKWQWNVINALKTTFPNVQFIIATHSPIVISSCENANLVQLDDKQEVRYLNDAYAYSIQDVVELRQGSSSIPQKLKELSERFDLCLNNNKIEEAKRIYEEMYNRYGEKNSEVKNAELELFLGEINLPVGL